MFDPTERILRLLVADTMQTLPAELLAFYRNPPGRRPHAHTLQVKEALSGLDDEHGLDVIRGTVDAALFNILYLIDSEFRGEGIEIVAKHAGQEVALSGSGLHELYRARVNPGGTTQD